VTIVAVVLGLIGALIIIESLRWGLRPAARRLRSIRKTTASSRIDLAKILSESLTREMTPQQKEAQRRSFAYGTTRIGNPAITRIVIDEAAASGGRR